MTQDPEVLNLRLGPTGARERYQVQVLDASSCLAQDEFTLRPADLAARLTLWTRREQRVEQALRQVGAWLWESVLGGEVGRVLSERLQAARESGRALRLELRIAPDAPELMALPWEALYDPGQESFLALSPLTSLARVPHDFIPSEPPEIRRPLRLLVVISSPPDRPEEERLDTARERRTIEGALRQLMESGLMEVDFVDEAAQEVIRKTLLARDYHLVHYTGHGGFDPAADGGQGDGYLVMEDGHDRTKKVYSADVARLFANTPVRLMVLSGCLTAQVSGKSALAARAAWRCAQAFAAAYAVKCESAPPLEQILIELGALLTANGDPDFDQAPRTDNPMRLKLAALVQALEKGPYLIIFDNLACWTRS